VAGVRNNRPECIAESMPWLTWLRSTVVDARSHHILSQRLCLVSLISVGSRTPKTFDLQTRRFEIFLLVDELSAPDVENYIVNPESNLTHTYCWWPMCMDVLLSCTFVQSVLVALRYCPYNQYILIIMMMMMMMIIIIIIRDLHAMARL